jgi:hypothetical protein
MVLMRIIERKAEEEEHRRNPRRKIRGPKSLDSKPGFAPRSLFFFLLAERIAAEARKDLTVLQPNPRLIPIFVVEFSTIPMLCFSSDL